MTDKTTDDSTPENNNVTIGTDQDRREYFRVADRAILRYKPVAADAIGYTPAERHFDNSEIFELLRDLRQIDQEHNTVLRGLAEQNRELGVYLKSMNRKIELVANALAVVDQTQQKQIPQTVSISETGIAFKTEDDLLPGSFIAMELILLPSHTALALYGEVLAQRDQSTGLTVISFVRLRDSDRQVMARHILQVQIAAKKQNQPL
ncbi:MAG: hypothetical protein JWM78_2929 [Verrucomicrobiaceae bacterium]|nr:hypothetical protein [Verrucomicrobiaceae bacterium]